MFYISFVVGEDQFYFWADTDDVGEANDLWHAHVTSSPQFAALLADTPLELYKPVLMQDETAVWNLGLVLGEGDDLGVLLAYAVGPIRLLTPTEIPETARRLGAV